MADRITHGVILDTLEQETELTLEAVEYQSFSPGLPFKTGILTWPETANNRAVFGELYDSDGSNKVRIIENVLFENGVTTSEGSLVITGQSYINRINTLTGFFIAGNGLLWLDFGDTNLRDLDWSAYEHTLQYSVLNNSVNELITYDLCDRGKFIDEDVVSIIERYPAFRIGEMLKVIFNGYDIQSNVLQSLWFYRLYLLFTFNSDIRNSEDWKESSLISIGKSSAQAIDLTVTASPKEFTLSDTLITFTDEADPHFDNGNNFASSVYTVPETGTYRFKFDASASMPLGTLPGDLSGEVKFSIYADAVKIAEQTYTILNQPTNSISNLIIDSEFIELDAGVEVSCFVNVFGEYTGSMTAGQIIISTTCTFENLVSRWYGYGSTVKPSEILPDISVNEFLKMVFEHFGIIPQYSNETNIVRLNIWKRNAEGIDLTNYLDPTTAQSEFTEPFNYEMNFKPDTGDRYGIDYFKRNPDKDGSYQANNGEKVLKVIQSAFSNTVMQPCYRLLGDDVAIPTLYSDIPKGNSIQQKIHENVPDWKTTFNYRILTLAGSETGKTYKIGFHLPGTGRTVYDVNYYIFCTTFDYQDISQVTNNIEFSDRDGFPGLHTSLHKAYIDRINNGQILTIQGMLPESYLNRIMNSDADQNIATPIYLNFEPYNGLWTVQKIVTNGKLSQLTLIRNNE